MKKKLTIITSQSFLRRFSLLLASSFVICSLLIALLSCEQPFKAGLGPMIDLQDPTIELERPTAGAYIRNEREFTGNAADDYKLDSAWFHISNYPEVSLPGYTTAMFKPNSNNAGGEYLLFHRIADTRGNTQKINWSFIINTKILYKELDQEQNSELLKDKDPEDRVLPDGDFKIRLYARDAKGKDVFKDEIVFYIKNNIPEIVITAPPIQPGSDPGYLGGDQLNYGYIKEQSGVFKRVMDTNSDLFGRISDFEGIYMGDWDPNYQLYDDDNEPIFDETGAPKTVEVFPPQIRFWQVNFGDTPPVDKDGNVITDHVYRPGYIPSLTEEPWRALGREAGGLTQIDDKNLGFEYRLGDNSGFYYAFQVRAQSKDSIHSTAEYPKDYINFEGADEDFKKENSYVLILVREPLEYPAIGLYRFEDIYGDGWGPRDNGIMKYLDLPKDQITGEDLTDQVKTDGNHVYVDKTIVSKKGPFILRVKTSHGGGMASAKAYWEKSDKSAKGRFIWDPVERPNVTPPWTPTPVPSQALQYYFWGLNEPDGVTRVKSFVFTYYDDDKKDKLPDEPAFRNNMIGNIAGRSKVQSYTKDPTKQLNKDGKIYDYDELPEGIENWDDVTTLEEGTYNIYIYATSLSGTRVPTPFNVTLYIDRVGPTIELNYIEGSAGEKRVNTGVKVERVNTVNGVIQPRFLFSDSRPTDTSIRKASSQYFADGSDFYSERAFILIPKADESLMAAYLALHPWPEFPNQKGGNLVLNVDANRKVTVSKHGPITVESSARFRTSKIYYGKNPGYPTPNPETADGEVLADGDYRMYVFARDNAFNVGMESWPIIVEEKSDYPKLDFSIGSLSTTAVTEPDSAFDFGGGAKYTAALPYEKSFITATGPRPMFTANSSIQVKVTDDDGLNLGVESSTNAPADDSGIVVTFIGSRPVKGSDGSWEIKADEDSYLMKLGQKELKEAFNPIQANEGGKRTKVTESRSNITHKMLLDLLKSKPEYNDIFTKVVTETVNGKEVSTIKQLTADEKREVNTIPDGVYRIGISVSDYKPAKLIMEAPNFAAASDPREADAVTMGTDAYTDEDDPLGIPIPIPTVTPAPNPPLKQKYTKYFWIAVDNHNPVIEIENETEISGGIILPEKPLDLKGKVSDENGPITLVDWRVRNGNTTESQMGKQPLKTDSPRIVTKDWVSRDYKDGKWVYEFAYQLDMNGRANGTYDFEVTFQDRFGNKATKILRNSVDNGLPRVILIKKIETFSRPMLTDAELNPGNAYPSKATPETNKGRLAVKVVNFTINATDDNGVGGVRWWLLPVDTGANDTNFVTTGPGVGRLQSTVPFATTDSKGYHAFPSNKYTAAGVYYGGKDPTNLSFNKGVYGVVDVKDRKFTIAFDSRQLTQPNGEYRLHIVAVDIAGNYSEFSDVTINETNVFQEVYFLQEEDKPYFGDITPGEAWANTVLTWPIENGVPKAMPVLGGAPIVRGTVWENNGFFGDGQQKDFWPKTGTSVPGSITIWFSGSAAALTGNWENDVKAGNNITGYVKKSIPIDSKNGLGMQGRNVSLAVALQELFPDEFKTDGNKRYIIKATDSPVNKLKEQTYPGTYNSLEGNATRMGVGDTNSDDEGIREARWKQYAFVYDAVPPKVVIDTPVKKPVQTYGKTFASTFILGGYIADANLEKTAGGDYYFDYYLNSDSKKTFTLKPRTGVNLSSPTAVNAAGEPVPTPPADSALVEGQHIYGITRDPNGKITVYFRIKASEVTKAGTGIIPEAKFNSLGDGQHTLTLWAADQSGKEGADWVDFIKDIEPPSITFSNLTGNNRPYTEANESRIVNKTTWWTTMTAADKQRLLLGNSATAPLPLTTIYYDTGIPELRGTITDLVSNIDLGLKPDGTSITIGNSDPNVGTGDINHSTSKFRYWIDDVSLTTPGSYLALIDGAGTKSVRWTILLTSNGQRNGKILSDGVHTIVMTAADTAGEEIPDAQRYMIAFRIDSKPPRSAVSVTGASSSVVYGNINYQSDPVFSFNLTGDDANLEKVVLTIKNTTTGKEEKPVEFTARDSSTWTYYPKGAAAPAATVTAPLSPPATPLADDYVLYKGLYGVPKTLFTDSGKYEVIVATKDTAGNKSEDFIFQFTYDKDPPEIEFTNPPDENKNASATFKPEDFIDLGLLPALVDANGKTKNNINRLTSENLRIQGNVKDTFSAIRVVQSRVERWNWLTAAWVQVEDWKDIPNLNLAANTQTQIAWTKNLLGQNNVAGQTAVDLDLRTIDAANPSGEGLYRIRIRAKDSSIINVPPGTDNWDSPLGSGTAALNGRGNPIFSQYMYFYYDRTNPILEITGINGSTTAMETYYSRPPAGGFTFEGTVTDNNRFANVEVKFEAGGVTMPQPTVTMSKFADADPAISLNQGAVKQKWKAAFANTNTTLPDGKYNVTVTVWDMTGRSTSEKKSFILDATPPTVRFTLPAKVLGKGYGDDAENPKPAGTGANGFASVDVLAGPTSVITGETGDKPGPNGEAGSQSGVDQMWFHLGFIDGNNNFPTKQNIKDWEDAKITQYARLVGTVNVSNGTLTDGPANASWNDLANLTIKQRNRYMDLVAERRATGDADQTGNAWFKLGGKRRPTGFVINNPNIYDWRFEIPNQLAPMTQTGDPDNYADHFATTVNGVAISTGVQIEGLKLYGGTITLKGRTYTVGATAARQMVRAIDGQPGGYYRLPLWIRLTDIAGNVEYYCHDIWIDMNGSIPSTTIESPSNGTKTTARGGSISVDGVAKSNTSVYDVIFRVFADGIGDPAKQNTDLMTATTFTRPATTARIAIPGYETADAASITVLNTYAGATYTDTPWQKANLAVKGGSGEPVIPWSIMLNSENHIANMIPTKGFIAGSGTTPDTIRVWLEVFVFNGEGAPIRSSIFSIDNPAIAATSLYGNANNGGAKPNVRVFFIKTGAAEITHPNVGTWNTGTDSSPSTSPFRRRNFMWNGEVGDAGGYKGAGQEMRSDKFAVSAVLNPRKTGTADIGEVAFRIKLDGGSYGVWNTVWKKGDNPLPTAAAPFNSAVFKGARISVRDTGRYYFDYAIDSKNATPPDVSNTSFAAVNGGNWANTGGTVTVQIRMRDDSNPPNEAERTIQVAIDNFTPLADTNYITNPKVAGTSVNFVGRVYDYANPASPLPTGGLSDSMNNEFTPRKLARVSVWFTKQVNGATRYVNMNQKNTTVATPPSTRNDVSVATVNTRTSVIPTGYGGVNDTVNNITVTNRGTNVAQFTYPGLGTQQAWNADYVRDITPATGQPVNKMLWAPVNAADYDVRWSLTLDSTLLPDGEMTLHYIVVDEAGNASYYTQTGISVRNNYPEITRVTLYTDNNGQGAQYTMDDTIEYDLNNYRGKMFANYTDSDDNQWLTSTGAQDANQTSPAPTSRRKTDTTGYLNSGFISKNKYVGFKVEATGGNRPLNFRLQHVTRERVTLDATTLQQMVTARAANSASTINLYTIAWHGDYTPQKWKALGVSIDKKNPTLGTHFVFNPVNLEDSSKAFVPADAAGTAQVWKYTAVVTRPNVINPTVTGQTSASDPFEYGPSATLRPTALSAAAAEFEFKDTHFGTSGTNVIKEYKGSNADDKDNGDPRNTAFFLIRVWDTINSTGSPAEQPWVNDQLYDALVVGMNVFLTDAEKPVARLYDLNPYTEIAVTGNNNGTDNQNATIKNAADPEAVGSNIVRGGLYNTNTERDLVKSGYIDPRNGSFALVPKNSDGVPAVTDNPLKVSGDQTTTGGATLDKVSGKIILRGLAQDDQLVGEIQIKIGSDAWKTILKLTNGKMTAQGTNQAYAAETLHWKTGHSVEWAYVWDTEKEPAGRTGGGPLSNVDIQVRVVDEKGPNTSITTSRTTTTPNSTPFHNQVSVDIVPYITGFERETPKFNTKRSLQGWYSFYRGEPNIAVRGYNLGQSAANVTVNLSSSSGAGTNITTAYNGTPDNTKNRFYFTIPTTANSGKLNVTVGTTSAHNHTSIHADKSWNREANSYTPGSTLWINKPYAHIWRTTDDNSTPRTYIGTTTSSIGLDHPGMALEYQGSGILHGTWAVYGNANSYYGTNNNSSYPLHTPTPGEPFSTPDISIFQGSGAANIGYTYQPDGRPRILVRSNVTTAQGSNTYDGTFLLQDYNTAGSTQRWQNVRLSKAAANIDTNETNVGRIYMTAFNADTKGLWFGTRGGTSSQTNNTMFIDGKNLGSIAMITASGETAVANAGQYSAVDYDDTGPIVAYYDGTNDTVRVALGTASNLTGGWTRRYLLPSGNGLYRGSGKYISIKVDKSNGIHLAFYNSVYNSVVYYYAASRTNISSAPNGTTIKCHTIDNVVSGGIWTDISVDNNGNPWIVYGDSSRTGNYDGVRMAYQSSAQTGIQFTGALTCPVTSTPANPVYITGWEALSMPANYTVGNDRLNIEAWPPTVRGGSLGTAPGWNAAIGYASDIFRVGYFYYPAWKGYGSNTAD